jgi:hypothetical protein
MLTDLAESQVSRIRVVAGALVTGNRAAPSATRAIAADARAVKGRVGLTDTVRFRFRLPALPYPGQGAFLGVQ